MASMEFQSFKTSILPFSVFLMLSLVLVAAEDLVPLPLLPMETYNFLEHCGTKIKPVCGEAIKAGVYKHEILSPECCQQLIAEGWACHDKFVQVTAPYYPEKNNAEVLDSSSHVWHECIIHSPKH